MSNAPVLSAAPRPAPAGGERRIGVVVVALLIAVLSFVGVWLLWRVFVDTLAGQQVENAAFQGARYGQTQLWRVAERVLDVVSVGFIAAVLIAAILIAAVRRRWSLAAQVVVLMVGANLTTRVLKQAVFSGPTSASRPATATRCRADTRRRLRRCRRHSCSSCPRGSVPGPRCLAPATPRRRASRL